MKRVFFLCLTLGFAGVPGAYCGTIFTTIGPANTFSLVNYGVDGNGEFQAFQFTPTAGGTLESVTVAVKPTVTGTTFRLYTGNSTALGVLLEEWTIMGNRATVPALVSLNSTIHPAIGAGANYWLSMTEPGGADGVASTWYFNDQGLDGTRLTNAGLKPGSWLAAFSVDVVGPRADTPEPAAAGLTGAGLAGLALVGARLRRKSIEWLNAGRR